MLFKMSERKIEKLIFKKKSRSLVCINHSAKISIIFNLLIRMNLDFKLICLFLLLCSFCYAGAN